MKCNRQTVRQIDAEMDRQTDKEVIQMYMYHPPLTDNTNNQFKSEKTGPFMYFTLIFVSFHFIQDQFCSMHCSNAFRQASQPKYQHMRCCHLSAWLHIYFDTNNKKLSQFLLDFFSICL